MPIECLLDRGRERKGGRASLQSAKTSRIYFVLAWRLLSHCAKIWNKAERAARRPKVCRCTMYLYAYRSTDSTSRNDCTYPVSCILHGRWSSPCIAHCTRRDRGGSRQHFRRGSESAGYTKSMRPRLSGKVCARELVGEGCMAWLHNYCPFMGKSRSQWRWRPFVPSDALVLGRMPRLPAVVGRRRRRRYPYEYLGSPERIRTTLFICLINQSTNGISGPGPAAPPPPADT